MKRTSILLTVLTTTALLVAGCGSDEPRATPTSPSPVTTSAPTTAAPTDTTSTTTPEPTPSQTPTPEATTASPTTAPTKPTNSQVINYETDDGGVLITRAADTAKLTGAPADFKKFVAAELARSRAEADAGCPEKPQLYVARLATGGWAAGGYFVPQCGGYAALWTKSAGAWKEVWSGQELVDCATLTKYAFPASVAGTSCLDGDKSVKYPRR